MRRRRRKRRRRRRKTNIMGVDSNYKKATNEMYSFLFMKEYCVLIVLTHFQ